MSFCGCERRTPAAEIATSRPDGSPDARLSQTWWYTDMWGLMGTFISELRFGRTEILKWSLLLGDTDNGSLDQHPWWQRTSYFPFSFGFFFNMFKWKEELCSISIPQLKCFSLSIVRFFFGRSSISNHKEMGFFFLPRGGWKSSIFQELFQSKPDQDDALMAPGLPRKCFFSTTW